MGIFSHSKLYSHKYINAEITDSGDRIHVVHLKHVLGDYFVTKIDGQSYVFRLKGKIYTYHALGMRTVRKIYYNTKHYMPISMDDYKLLQKTIEINGLPKLDRTLFDTLRYLGKTERAVFVPHDMESVFRAISQQETKYAKEAQAMKDFLEHLNIDKIVTPVKEVTEFFQGDMIASDPQFFGDVIPALRRVDHEDKKITNTPIRGKGPWLKIIIIGMIVIAITGFALYAYNTGMFSNMTLPGMPGVPTINELAAKYPTPESLRIAVDGGQVDPNTLPNEMKKWLDSYKPPTITPKSNTIELTP